MTRTEERLADALDAAARAMPEDDMRPLIVPLQRSRRLAWAAPAASAAGLLLVVGLAVVVAGHLPGSGRMINTVPAPHPYYVAADRNGDLPQVRSTATGQVTDTLNVAHVPNAQEPALVAAVGNVFFAAVAQRAGEALYRFRLTATGKITDLSPLPRGMLAGTDWDVHTMAASPDGGWLAFAMTYTGPATCESAAGSSVASLCPVAPSDALYTPSSSDSIAIVNTATGQKSASDAAGPTIGSPTGYYVPSLSWSANSRSVNFIVQGCPLQGTSIAKACTSAATGGSSRSASVWQISRRSGSGHLRARRVHPLDPLFSYVPAAQLSPDGSTITAVLPPELILAHDGSAPYVLEVAQLSAATENLLGSTLYTKVVPGLPVTLKDLPDAALSTDATGRHWLLSVSYCNQGSCGGFNGWIDHGNLVALPPGNGNVADEAW